MMESGRGAAAVGSVGLGLGLAASAGTHDVCDRGLRPARHPEEDDIVPELTRSIHPRERPDWEETISAMARSAEVPEMCSEPLLRSCSSTASMKVKNVKKLSFTKGHFPKLAECAHFHYENVDFGTLQLSLADEQSDASRNGLESKELVYLVQIYCQGRSWIVRRSYEDFRVLDKHLHLCIYDRRFSQLPELPRYDSLRDRAEVVSQMLTAYLSRLSAIADNKINCGPALTWMELDNKGNRLLVHEESSINVPAIAAAHVIKRYIAQAADELSFEVGDIVSVIDMPPKEDTSWWRGKHGFQVGFFPSECVELINDKVPQSVTNSVPKPVSKKHGKLITFLRTFMKSRPTKQKLKQRGILRERVFGCDLGEHLLNSGHDVPQVLKSCTEFIEKHGVVDGMYRLSGIASNIQKLRHEFDSEQIPDLTRDVYIQDIHCVGSLCKLYFRELPNPLLTYQLYEKFSEAVSAATDEERLIKIHDVIQQLPPPHYRTLEFLMRHLSRLATFSYVTNMHSKNLAIVWAPNLLRSKQIESACFSGTAAFMEVRIQSVVVEFILNHVEVLFSPKLSSLIREGAGPNSLSRPKSLLVPSPSTKLLTLEEAQARTQAQINSPVTADSKYIEVGEGPGALQGKFHTVIEFPTERKRPPIKSKKSPVGNWRSFFSLGKSSSMSKRKLHRNPSEPSELKAMALAGGRGDTGTLRSAKSEESLSSLHNIEGESKVFRPRRPRSSSDALSSSFNGDLLDSRQHCNSYDNVGDGESDGDDGPICVPALISPPRSADDVDLSPPDIGMASLDFDPMSFQCSLPLTETSLLSSEPGTTIKKSPGSACGSEPASPSQKKEAAGTHYLSSDFSQVFKEVTKCSSASLSESQAQEKAAMLTLFPDPAAVSLIGRVSEGLGASSTSPPGLQAIPPAVATITRTSELLDLHCSSPDSGGPEIRESADTESLQMSRSSSGQEHPGAVALDSPKGRAPVSSVSLLPPPLPPKNTARMLALALAESAQQSAVLSQRQPREPLLLDPLEWPEPPSLRSLTPVDEGDNVCPMPAPSSSPPTVPAEKTELSVTPQPCTADVPGSAESLAASCVRLDPTAQLPSPANPPAPASPTLATPEREQPAMGQVPVSPIETKSTPTAATSCSALSSRLETGTESQPATESRSVETAQKLPPSKPTEQPVAVLQPQPKSQPQAQAQSQPQHHPVAKTQVHPQPNAKVAPTPAIPFEPTEKPWEAIKPVQPQVESTYHHAHGITPPPPPVRSMESKLATAALCKAEASNFHTMMPESAVPGPAEEALPQAHPASRKFAYVYHSKGDGVLLDPASDAYYHPRAIPVAQGSAGYHYRPESVSPNPPYGSKPEHQLPYSARPDTRYNTVGPRSFHQSFKSRGPPRGEYVPGSGSHRSHGYSHVDGAAVYPTIRRVHSLHVPPTAIHSVPVSRTEVPPEDELYYYQRPVYHCKSHQQSSQVDYHVTQLQPYFENGRVQYRYSPYSGSHPLDAPYYDVDPYGTIRLRHVHSLSSRDMTHSLSRSAVKSGGYHYLSRHAGPPGKEHSFVSRDMPPFHGSKTAVYYAWDPEEAERLRIHSIRRESRARQKVKGPVMSQYDNVGSFMPADQAGVEVLHLRSKSDPGKAILVAPEDKEVRYNVMPGSQHASRHLMSDPDVLLYMETEKHCQGSSTGDKTSVSKHGSRTYPSSHMHHSQPRSLQHLPDMAYPDSKYDDAKPSSKHWQDHSEPRSFQPRYERPDPDRHIGWAKSPGAGAEDDQHAAPVKATAPTKPERSHSVRGERQHYSPANPSSHHQDNPDRDHPGGYAYQPHGQRQSTMTVQSHYDNLDDYHPAPQPQAPGPNRAGLGSFPTTGYPAQHNHRAYSTALGQGAFIQSELPQRPETEIRAE
ncbi:rho GTPase-activating protein 32 isoform X3 [Denticeps clupeoides]|uniref:rho GTPase-activating protein 32 isoform X3 n=1 Tax=Denticeps clupeoides TaxID=299321 RepID=UPI0010A55EE4|nr:rho GTPase-activating protein 32 isoform X3 [Denticeps clupeoides]